MRSIPGILLAAGGSERFGSEKLIKRLPSGEVLIERALKVHLLSSISPLILVASPSLWRIIGEGSAFSTSTLRIEKRRNGWHSFFSRWGRGRIVVNEDSQKGMSSSIHKGLSCLRDKEQANGILISLSDLPLLTTGTIDFLIHRYVEEKIEILVPVFNDTTGHPVIFDMAAFKEDIARIEGDAGLRVLIKNYPERVTRVPWHDDSVTWDVDTPRDLERLARLG
ncbi:MAG: nucleotidyltransferase family protein [Deltaproteobacteria bacterium]|nr:nucleotidyltransferase family protein [Deltaproteobacteria bacterium]